MILGLDRPPRTSRIAERHRFASDLDTRSGAVTLQMRRVQEMAAGGAAATRRLFDRSAILML